MIESMREMLNYDPQTGIFVWRTNPPRKRNLVGAEAGSIAGNGYKQIKLGGKVYAQHRLAFLFFHGREPRGEIDHINGHKQDNRIANLREVTSSENKHNIRTVRSRSGFLGVTLDSRRGRFVSRILVGGKNLFLGSFDTPELAHAAYISAKKKHHPGYVPQL